MNNPQEKEYAPLNTSDNTQVLAFLKAGKFAEAHEYLEKLTVNENSITDERDQNRKIKGGTYIENEYLYDKRLKGELLKTYLLLMKYSRRFGYAFAGVEKLGQILGVSRIQVMRYTKELVKLGYLEIARQGNTKTNHYYVKTPRIPPEFVAPE